MTTGHVFTLHAGVAFGILFFSDLTGAIELRIALLDSRSDQEACDTLANRFAGHFKPASDAARETGKLHFHRVGSAEVMA